MAKAGYLYAVELKGGVFKIGRSTNVGRRFYSLFFGEGKKITDAKAKFGSPVRVVGTCRTSDYIKAEGLALNILRLKYSTGCETFPCSEAEALQAISLACEMAP